ncbi:MAG: PP2C family serine/threonine-protein phosphatase, partial [Leptolyngbyaceae cyanobacterium bins.59]|nr:PP2C family serine/threonine-protein phosphatase [Leptolyngbyaceae cyanobacterium bins.59]
MKDVTTSIYCSNAQCQFPNAETNHFCQQCRSPLTKRYLWVVGDRAVAIGPMVNDRYQVKSPRVWLDTKPGLLPEFPNPVPDRVVPYLRLFADRLHIPQPFGGLGQGVLLLEDAPLRREPPTSEIDEDWLCPSLGSVWPTATPFQQLHFLWQIAHLWYPLHREGATVTLLMPDLLRLEGSLVRVLELQFDRNWPTPPDLVTLGKGWSSLAKSAHPSIQPFLEELCHHLTQRRIRGVDPLMVSLEKGLEQIGRLSTRQIYIATLTDQGPSRQRNEDACHPPTGTQQSFTSNAQGSFESPPLTLVCDGIGGHEGGNIASQLAIDAIQREVQGFSATSTDSDTVIAALERAIGVANNQISQRNDSEKRHDRQRMGTTVVLALARAHLLYVAHVGDSRVYRITRSGCHQVTLDDDLASREVRLGYAFYRDAQQVSTSGSLIQALGMGNAVNLHPTVQSFVLDEECVFLLCSDGLSDYDRVEDWWEPTILPLLDGQVDLLTATRRWLEIANTLNGHDNVTVSLLHCRVAAAPPSQPIPPGLVVDLASMETAS